MANIPNSSQYRISGNKASSNARVAGCTWTAHHDSNAHGRTADQPNSMSWLWGLVALGLLIALPYHVLAAIGLALIVGWYVGKK